MYGAFYFKEERSLCVGPLSFQKEKYLHMKWPIARVLYESKSIENSWKGLRAILHYVYNIAFIASMKIHGKC